MNLGLNLGAALIYILNVALILAWIGLSIACLFNLRNRPMPATAKAIWALMITVVPLVGAIAYLIVKPSE